MSAIKTQETSAVPAWAAGTADVSCPPPLLPMQHKQPLQPLQHQQLLTTHLSTALKEYVCWVLLYFKLQAKLPDAARQTLLKLTQLGRCGIKDLL